MKTRTLSPVEELFYWRTELGMYTNFCVAADYGKTLEPLKVLKTIKLICDEYPNLRTNVKREGERDVKLVYIDEIDFSETIKVIDDESMIINDALSKIQEESFRYGDSKPLWRIVIFNKTKLLFYTDHLLCDGMSGANFHKVFHEKLESQKEIKVETLLPPPDDLITGYNAPFLNKCYMILTELAPKSLANWIYYLFDPYKDLTYIEFPRVAKEPSKLRMLSYNSNTVNDIIGMCRAHDVKLTSLLTHIGLLAAKRITCEFDSKTVIPTNGRALMREDTGFDTKFGLFMGHVDFFLPSMDKINGKEGFNWDVTRRIHKIIHDGYKGSCYDLGILSLVDTKDLCQKSKNSKFGPTLEVSNIGKLPLKEVWFDQQVIQTLFGLSVVCGEENLNISVRCLKADHLEGFYQDVKLTMDTLLKGYRETVC